MRNDSTVKMLEGRRVNRKPVAMSKGPLQFSPSLFLSIKNMQMIVENDHFASFPTTILGCCTSPRKKKCCDENQLSPVSSFFQRSLTMISGSPCLYEMYLKGRSICKAGQKAQF